MKRTRAILVDFRESGHGIGDNHGICIGKKVLQSLHETLKGKDDTTEERHENMNDIRSEREREKKEKEVAVV